MKPDFTKSLVRLAVPAIILMISSPLVAQTISVGKLATAPALDGSDADWQNIPATVVPVAKKPSTSTVEVKAVSVRAGIFGDDVYLFLQWDDPTRDEQHKPFVWDAAQNKYVTAELWEDRIAVEFAMKGDYTTDWFSGKSFEADMWHWKAARSNPLGLVHDQMTIIGTDPVAKAFKATATNGREIFIRRPSDAGDELYDTKRYGTREQDTMPKYVLTENPKGSVTDIHCRGVWQDGKWNLEIRRKLNTGNPDDIVFAPGAAVPAGIAVFDHSGDDNHAISDTLTFQFP